MVDLRVKQKYVSARGQAHRRYSACEPKAGPSCGVQSFGRVRMLLCAWNPSNAPVVAVLKYQTITQTRGSIFFLNLYILGVVGLFLAAFYEKKIGRQRIVTHRVGKLWISRNFLQRSSQQRFWLCDALPASDTGQTGRMTRQ